MSIYENESNFDKLNMYTAGDSGEKKPSKWKVHRIVVTVFWVLVVLLVLGRLFYDTITNVTDSYIKYDGKVSESPVSGQRRMTFHLGEKSNSFLIYEEIFEGNQHKFDRIAVCDDLTDYNRYGEFVLSYEIPEDMEHLHSECIWTVTVPDRYKIVGFDEPVHSPFSGKYRNVEFKSAFVEKKKKILHPGEDTVLFAIYLNQDEQGDFLETDELDEWKREHGFYQGFANNENTLLIHIVLSEKTKEELLREFMDTTRDPGYETESGN